MKASVRMSMYNIYIYIYIYIYTGRINVNVFVEIYMHTYLLTHTNLNDMHVQSPMKHIPAPTTPRRLDTYRNAEVDKANMDMEMPQVWT